MIPDGIERGNTDFQFDFKHDCATLLSVLITT